MWVVGEPQILDTDVCLRPGHPIDCIVPELLFSVQTLLDHVFHMVQCAWDDLLSLDSYLQIILADFFISIHCFRCYSIALPPRRTIVLVLLLARHSFSDVIFAATSIESLKIVYVLMYERIFNSIGCIYVICDWYVSCSIQNLGQQTATPC